MIAGKGATFVQLQLDFSEGRAHMYKTWCSNDGTWPADQSRLGYRSQIQRLFQFNVSWRIGGCD